MKDFLQIMRAKTLARVKSLRHESSERQPQDFLSAFKGPKTAIIAELKFATPSKGLLRESGEVLELAGQYLQQGAVALSILTEPEYFKGSIKYLQAIREAYPQALLLLKDFILDQRQLIQAKACGADAVLLIASFLSAQELTSLYQQSLALGLTPLVEIYDLEELKLAESLGAALIGVNSRNLNTFEVNVASLQKIPSHASRAAIFLALSGLSTAEELLQLKHLGYQGFLIGSYFMQQQQPGAALAELLGEVENATR